MKEHTDIYIPLIYAFARMLLSIFFLCAHMGNAVLLMNNLILILITND